jgi:hypothetical protein
VSASGTRFLARESRDGPSDKDTGVVRIAEVGFPYPHVADAAAELPPHHVRLRVTRATRSSKRFKEL